MKGKIYTIDSQGMLHFEARREIEKRNQKHLSFLENPVVSIVAMFGFALLDIILFNQVFASFLYDSLWVRIFSIIGLIAGFDVAPIVLAIVLKGRSQGLNHNRLLAYVSGIAFLLALAASILLRILVKDLVLPNFSDGLMLEEDFQNKDVLLPIGYALFGSILPVVTSLASFAVTYLNYNPLKIKYYRLRQQKFELEKNIQEIEAILNEYELYNDKSLSLLEEDYLKFQNSVGMVNKLSKYYGDYTRNLIKEYLKDPASTNELSKSTDGVFKE